MQYPLLAHIPAERWWLASLNVEITFSEIELDHIKGCNACVRAWKHFIEKNEAEKHENGSN